MTERAETLAARLDDEMLGMADFVQGLDSAQLAAACGDPMGATVGHVLEHLRDGTAQVRGWAATATGGGAADGAPPTDHAHDHAHGNGHAHGAEHAHEHTHGNGHAHAHEHGDGHAHGRDEAVGDGERTAATLREGAAEIGGVIRGLSDEQLDTVPPASPGLADGVMSLHAIVEFIAEDVARHKAHLVRALDRA